MTVTKEMAMAAGDSWSRVVFHYAPACSLERVERWRTNGKCQTWKRDTKRFRLPVKFGLYGYSAITDLNADEFHIASDCPIESQRNNY
jgi:hypothetical protein